MRDHRDDATGAPFVTWALCGLLSWFGLAVIVLAGVEVARLLGGLL